jgi:hypothetical protein
MQSAVNILQLRYNIYKEVKMQYMVPAYYDLKMQDGSSHHESP